MQMMDGDSSLQMAESQPRRFEHYLATGSSEHPEVSAKPGVIYDVSLCQTPKNQLTRRPNVSN